MLGNGAVILQDEEKKGTLIRNAEMRPQYPIGCAVKLKDKSMQEGRQDGRQCRFSQLLRGNLVDTRAGYAWKADRRSLIVNYSSEHPVNFE